MAQLSAADPVSGPADVTIERRSPTEFTVTRFFAAAPATVYAAWTRPDLLLRWWAPRSMPMRLISCDVDARPGGRYRFVFGGEAGPTVTFHGRYVEAEPPHRLVWTNEESPDGALTTLTLTAVGVGTALELRETYTSPAALDEAIAGMETCAAEQYAQLDALLEAAVDL